MEDYWLSDVLTVTCIYGRFRRSPRQKNRKMCSPTPAPPDSDSRRGGYAPGLVEVWGNSETVLAVPPLPGEPFRWASGTESLFVAQTVRMSVRQTSRVCVIQARLVPTLLEIHLLSPGTGQHQPCRQTEGHLSVVSSSTGIAGRACQ
jgi:hypothetical protein